MKEYPSYSELQRLVQHQLTPAEQRTIDEQAEAETRRPLMEELAQSYEAATEFLRQDCRVEVDRFLGEGLLQELKVAHTYISSYERFSGGLYRIKETDADGLHIKAKLTAFAGAKDETASLYPINVLECLQRADKKTFRDKKRQAARQEAVHWMQGLERITIQAEFSPLVGEGETQQLSLPTFSLSPLHPVWLRDVVLFCRRFNGDFERATEITEETTREHMQLLELSRDLLRRF